MADIGHAGIVGRAEWLGAAIVRALLDSGRVPSDRLICPSGSGKLPWSARGPRITRSQTNSDGNENEVE